jgi:hypothetical protein
VNKSGYNSSKSVNIAVEKDIVKFDIAIDKTNISNPVITLVGNTEMTIHLKSKYEEPGLKATDSNGVSLEKLVITNGVVDTSKIGDYVLNYTVTDATGNKTIATRTIHVRNHTKPFVVLNGAAKVTVVRGSKYVELGVTSSDALDKDITDRVTTKSTVNTAKIGEYNVEYSVTDEYGNRSDTLIRMVKVVEPSKLTDAKVSKPTVNKSSYVPKSIVISNNIDIIAGKILAVKTSSITKIVNVKTTAATIVEYIKKNKNIDTVYILGGTGIINSEIEKQIKTKISAKIIRIGGTDAYATASLITKYMKVAKHTPVIVTSRNINNQLKAKMLKLQYPILLTGTGSLNKFTKEMLVKLMPNKVYVYGDTKLISESQLKEITKMLKLNKNEIIRITK